MPAFFFTVVSLFLLFILIPLQTEPSEGGPIALSPRLFCDISGYLLLTLSIILALSSVREAAGEQEADEPRLISTDFLVRGGVAVLVSFLYVMIMPKLGYFVSTTITMIFFLWFFGVREIKGYAVFLMILLPFVYLLFVLGLKVLLPSGVAF